MKASRQPRTLLIFSWKVIWKNLEKCFRERRHRRRCACTSFKTCLGHLRGSFYIIYHDIEAIWEFWKSSNFCRKCKFSQFLIFSNMYFKYRFFLQKSLKIGFEAFKSFFELPKHLQIPWLTIFDDMKVFWKIMKIHRFSWISALQHFKRKLCIFDKFLWFFKIPS